MAGASTLQIRRRETDDVKRHDKDRRMESPSRKRRRDRTVERNTAREAGEIPEGRYRDRDTQHHSKDRHRRALWLHTV